MAQYLSPGVYVEEVPPLSRPIAGVGTSTPGFIGVVADTVFLPSNPIAGDGDDIKKNGFRFVKFVLGAEVNKTYQITSWKQYTKLFGDFIDSAMPLTKTVTSIADGADKGKVLVNGTAGPGLTVTVTFKDNTAVTTTADAGGKYGPVKSAAVQTSTDVTVTTTITDAGAAVSDGQRRLAHAVYGFFNNGGSGCYVIRIAKESDLDSALSKFAVINDITMVAAPGIASAASYASLTAHCENLKDRVAILDPVETDTSFNQGDFSKLQGINSASNTAGRPQNSTYSAFYFPWLQVDDPAATLMNVGNGAIFVPPSGHIAGVFAKTDANRGVFKAPANEALLGVIGLKYSLSKADQDLLNDDGVNLIRQLVGAFRVWGARTVGGDANGEYRYISTRRYFNYLRESIDQGTQFVVFEPNSPALWERIKRTVGGFLMNEWRAGALFGTTPDKAFYVKCDSETNPPEVREAGQVVTEIGIAIVKPAEFVIFRIQQMAGA